MYKIRTANFLDFIEINNIYEKYYRTEFGRRNTKLFYQFILFLLNDFLKLFNSNFFENYCLEKNGKIIGIWSLNAVSKKIRRDNATCIIPEERGKGLAKFLCKKTYEMLKKNGVKYVYSLRTSRTRLFVKTPTPKHVSTLYHYRINWKELKTTSAPIFQLCKYEISYFPSISNLITSEANDSIFTLLFFNPPKNRFQSLLQRIFYLIAFTKVLKYCIKKDDDIIGYIEINYYPHLRELAVYILLKKRIEYSISELKEIFEKNNIPISKLNLHIFVKPNGKRILKEFKKTNLFEMKRNLLN